MAEYIDRKEAIKAIESLPNCYNGFSDTYDKACIIGVLEEVPVADVSPVKHGKWKYFHKQNIAVCTNCSFERGLDANFGCAVSCSNCGARMDGE